MSGMVGRPVVITGLGVISALGHDGKAFCSQRAAGQTGIRPLDRRADDLKPYPGAVVPDYDPAAYFTNETLPLLDRFSQFAVIAGREALRDAALAPAILKECAAVVGTGCGGKQTDEETYAQLYKAHRKRAHPLTIPRGMPSAAASQVSIQLGIYGPVFSVASACASGAHALIQGALIVQSGLAEAALVGATDAPFTYGLMKSWEALRVLSSDTCRPFSANRSGLVLGEGAAMLVIETADAAARRGARVYATIEGYGQSADADHITRPRLDGVTRALRRTLDHAGLSPEAVGYINAHGTGTISNDPVETRAIRDVFGAHADHLLISSTKSMHGHALGAASAMELVATALALHHQTVPPTVNYTTPDPECNLDCVPNTARKHGFDYALAESFAFGGLNAAVILGRP
jgi:nodulation protein E